MFIRRFVQLQIGLLLYGASLALMVRANLGLNPWSVFHQGLSELTGLSLGMIVNLVGAVVLLIWIPLRQRPGIGTVCNVLVIGTAADVALAMLPPVTGLPLQVALLIGAILLNGAATGAYIGAGLGPGPRDGLTTGGVRVTGWEVRWVRMTIEGLVLVLGWMLGGAIGVGTLAYALSNGALLQIFLPLFEIRSQLDLACRHVAHAASQPTEPMSDWTHCPTSSVILTGSRFTGVKTAIGLQPPLDERRGSGHPRLANVEVPKTH